MRWRWYSAAWLAVLAAGCVTRTEQYWVPTAGDPRRGVEELRATSNQVLGADCPRLAGDPAGAGGEAELRILVAPDGGVTRARIVRSSGDARVDGIFGALAARLTLDRRGASSPRSELPLRIGYSCTAGAPTTTVQLP